MSTEFFNDQWRIPSNENQNKISNYSMDFDGSSDSININSLASTLGSKGSFSAWVNVADWSSRSAILGFAFDADNFLRLGVRPNNNNCFSIGGQFNNVSNEVISDTTSLSENVWYHVVATSDGSTYNLYVNGQLQTLTILGGSNNGDWVSDFSSTANRGRIGSLNRTGSTNEDLFNGKIDQVTIFDYALSQDQVTQLGAEGYAFNFNGSPQAIDCGANSRFDIDQITISGWVKLDSSITSTQVIAGVRNANNGSICYHLQNSGSNSKFRFVIRQENGTYADAIADDIHQYNTWYHVVGVADGSNVKLYINGIPQTDVGTYDGTIESPNQNFNIGRQPSNPLYYWDGELSDIAVFNTGLSQSQVNTIYNNGKPGDISSLNPVAWYKLDNNEIFNSTSTEWSVDNNAYSSTYKSSLNFSGNNQYLQVPDSNDFSFGNGTTDSPFSLSAWINPDAVEFAGVVAKYVSGIYEWLLYLTDLNKLRLQLQGNNSTANSINLTTDIAIPRNTWTHVSATYNANGESNGINLYINGLLQSLTTEGGNGTYQAMTNTTAPLQIGTWAGNFRPINAQVSNVSIWDAELSQAQVAEIYNNGTPSNLSSHSATSNLISWWELDNTTTGLQDSKGSNNASNIGTTKYDGFVNTLVGDSVGMTSSNLVASDINGELITNPMITSPKPIAYYQLGDQSAYNGSNYLVPNNSLSNYVFNFSTNNEGINLGSYFPYPSTVTDAWSVSFWIKRNETSSGGYIFSTYKASSTTGIFVSLRGASTAGTIQALVRGSTSGQYSAVKTNDAISLNGWTHVVAVYNGNSASSNSGFTIYFNGFSKGLFPFGSTGQTGSLINSSDKYIGQREDNSSYLKNCELTQLSFFHYELSSSQVDTLYNNGAPGDISSLNPKRLYKLDSSEIFNSTSTEWSVDNNAYPSVYKSSLNFDGNNNYINCGNNSSLQITGAMTISYWVKGASTNGASGVGTIESITNPGYILGPSTTGTISFVIGLTSSSLFTVVTTQQITTTEWHHIVGVYTPSVSMKIYIDGQLSKTETSSIPSSQYVGGNDFRIGYRTCCKIDGQISNVAIWNTDLSSTQVSTLYNNGAPEASISHSPVSWWKLDNITTGLQDSAGSNDGTNNGATEYAGFVNTLAGESSGMTSANLVVSDLQQTSGYSPYALSLDSSNANSFTLDNGGGNGLLNAATSFTISAWINPNQPASFGNIFTHFTGGVMLRFNSSGNIQLYVTKEDNTFPSTSAFNALTFTGNWQHVVAIYDGSFLKIYVDNVLVNTPLAFSDTLKNDTSSSSDIIGNRFNTTQFFDGEMSNVAVWKNSVIDVNTLYNQGLPGDLTSLNPSGWWQMGSNSSFNATASEWTCLDEVGTNNAESSNNMTNDAITDGPGYSASGLGSSSIDIKGDAPYSTANGLSENMDVLDRTTDVPS